MMMTRMTISGNTNTQQEMHIKTEKMKKMEKKKKKLQEYTRRN
jgi:hypothetical protein